MRSHLLVATTAALLAFSVGSADAKVKTRTLTGAAIGAGAGAVVAGPPGAVVGGVAGAYIGGPNLPPRRKCWWHKGVRRCR
jgi:osmotically inducible lipoprotein OsmB